MFCPNCGNQLPDNSSFCPSCGQNLNAAVPAVQQTQQVQQVYGGNQRQQQRMAEINELNRMINYFSQKSAEYDEYDLIANNMARLSLGYSTKKMVWGIILSVFGFIFTLGGIASVADNGAPVLLIFGLIVLAVGVLLIVLHVTGRAKFVKDRDYAYMRFDQLSDELNSYYQAYGYCPVGAEYTNPSNLAVILDTIRSGRADTTMDAINILVEDAHRNNMEAMARQTAVNTAAAARGARAGAIFSAANFFLK